MFKRISCFLCLVFVLVACKESGPDLSNIDWDTYLGDPGRQHYSPLVQINRLNVAELEEVWRYRSGELKGLMYTSPLVKDGVLYGLSPSLNVFALNAEQTLLFICGLLVFFMQAGFMALESG